MAAALPPCIELPVAMTARTQRPGAAHRGFFYALAGVVAVSANFVVMKYALRGFGPETFSLVITSAAAFWSLAMAIGRSHGRQLWIPRVAVGRVTLMGVILGIGMVLDCASLAILDPSFSAFLWRFAPVLTIALGAIVLRERLSAGELAPAALMILGGAVSAIGRWQIVGLGVLLTLLSCLAVAVQMLLTKMLVAEIESDALVFYGNAIGAMAIALWLALFGRIDLAAAAPYWLATLLSAFLGPCLSLLLYTLACRHWDLSHAAVVRATEPLFVLPMAYFALHQLPAPRELLGGALILAGALWLGWMQLSAGRET